MSKNKFPKSVSFNLKNKSDQSILEHVKKRNFSGYVKKLILADMEKGHVDIPNTSQEEQQQQQSPSLSKFDTLRQQLESAKQIHSNPQNNTYSNADSEKHN